MKSEREIHEFTTPPIHQLQGALESRHLANLTRSEVARALRALSSCYVERRGTLASGAPLETAGKRAAFALYYAPLHFAIASAVVRETNLAARQIRTIHDVGCGTGVAGAAWALESGAAPFVAATDRSGWAVGEANWLFQQLGVRGRASRADALRGLRARRGAYGPQDALLFAYSLNELPTETRAQALAIVTGAVQDGAALLVIEPIGKRLGNATWWQEWRAALARTRSVKMNGVFRTQPCPSPPGIWHRPQVSIRKS